MKSLLVLISALSLVSCSDSTAPRAPATDPEVPSKPSASKPAPKPAAPAVTKPTVKPGEITGVQIGQLFTMMQSNQVYLVDVRPPIFYRLGHIEGAINFPLKKYDTAFPKHYPLLKAALASGKTVVLYCQNLECPDAYKTALKLVQYGHNISIYKGGWEEWKKSGLQQ